MFNGLNRRKIDEYCEKKTRANSKNFTVSPGILIFLMFFSRFVSKHRYLSLKINSVTLPKSLKLITIVTKQVSKSHVIHN